MHKVLGAPAYTLVEHVPVRHKQRRAPLDTLFSKTNNLRLEPLLMKNIEKSSERFHESLCCWEAGGDGMGTQEFGNGYVFNARMILAT